MNPIDRLVAIARKPTRLALGLMSGMSRDGLDIALVQIENARQGRVEVDLLATHAEPYDPALRSRLARALDARPGDIAALDFELATRWSDAVLAFLEREGVEPDAVDLLGSHGQTIQHTPREDDASATTLQIGQADVLAERTGILTVSDFRPRDIAAEGEGAPLIPLADWLLFAEPGITSACQNLGSIANVTVVTPERSDMVAFDTGPANALIDAFAGGCAEGQALGGYDRDGNLSARGAVNDDVLLSLYTKRARWLAQAPPKSAGYDTFGPALAETVRRAHPRVSGADLTRTAVEFTASTLKDAYESHVRTRFPDVTLVRFSGGGGRNPTLMGRIREEMERLGFEVEVLEPRWADFKEAVGFALLADATVRGLPGNVPSATGAERAVVLGKISL